MSLLLTPRLSPSGSLIGSPPGLIGGGASVVGRAWIKQGAGAVINVPNPAADVAGTTLAVDLRPAASGYKYDVELDCTTFGTGAGFSMNLVASTDGITYNVIYTPQGLQTYAGECRLHLTNYVNPNALPIVSIKAIVSRSGAAGADLTYAPAETVLRIREYSAS
jgi:hypothetical protein